MAHECPECGEKCICISGDIVERNCEHCDDFLEEDDDYEEIEGWVDNQ